MEAKSLSRPAPEARLDRGETLTYDDMTIAGLVQAIRNEIDGGKLFTAADRTSLNHIDRPLGLKWVSKLSALDIKDFAQACRAGAASESFPKGDEISPSSRNQTAEAAVAPATLSLDIMYLKNLLETGQALFRLPPKDQILKDARKELQKLRWVGKSQEVSRLPTEDEFENLVDYACRTSGRRRVPLDTILRIARSTGLREAELCRVAWPDLDRQRRVLMVRKRKNPREKRDKLMPLIPNHGIDPLEEILSLQAHRPASMRATDQRIVPYRPGSVGAAFRRACKVLGIIGLRLHDLRHDAATGLARRREVHVKEAMLVLGHDDIKSMARYTHFSAEEAAARHAPRAPDPSGSS
jgi:integrase